MNMSVKQQCIIIISFIMIIIAKFKVILMFFDKIIISLKKHFHFEKAFVKAMSNLLKFLLILYNFLDLI